ncbi:MAG: terminase small subunit, partial [Acidobacteriales bacterium]|nr:terminase small subunit [Terriglobales bacterium]
MANREEIAKLLGVTVRRVNQLVRDEGMPRVREGEYDRAQVLVWYSRFLLRNLERAGDPSDLQGLRELRTQKHRLLRAQGDAAELALMQERTAVVPVQLYREV